MIMMMVQSLIQPPQVESLARMLLLAVLVGQGVPAISSSSVRQPGLLRFVAEVSQIRQRCAAVLRG